MMKEIASNIYVSTEYPGVNVGFIVRPAGVIAVDAPTLPKDAHAWRRQIIETTGGPILYTVLTDAHPHRLLNAGLLEAPIVAARAAYIRAADYTDGFWRNVVRGLMRCYPDVGGSLADLNVVLPEILFNDNLTLHKGQGDVTVVRVAGNAPGSSWVDLREEGVLFTGDTLITATHPILDASPDTKAWLDTLAMLRRSQFSGVVIVPGRGPLCDQSASQVLSEYIRTVRRRARSLHRTGRPQADMEKFVSELLSMFPVSEERRDQRQRRVQAGLERVYQELQSDSGSL
jgi:cyclase